MEIPRPAGKDAGLRDDAAQIQTAALPEKLFVAQFAESAEDQSYFFPGVLGDRGGECF
jgi:hypothetical protein